MEYSRNEEEQGRGIMADRFDLDAIEADDALLDLLAAGGESARAAGEHDPAVALLADLRLAVEVEDELPVETIDDPESFLARCAALNPITDPFARKVATRGLAVGVAAVAALSVSGVAAAVTGDPLSPYEKVIEKMVDAVRPQTSFPQDDLNGLPVVDRTKIVKVGKNYQEKTDAKRFGTDTEKDGSAEEPQARSAEDPPSVVVPPEGKPQIDNWPLVPPQDKVKPQDPGTDEGGTKSTPPEPTEIKPSTPPKTTDDSGDKPTDTPTDAPTDTPTDTPTDPPTTPTDEPTDTTTTPTPTPTDSTTATPPANVETGTDGGTTDGGNTDAGAGGGTGTGDNTTTDPGGNPTTDSGGTTEPGAGQTTSPSDDTTPTPGSDGGGTGTADADVTITPGAGEKGDAKPDGVDVPVPDAIANGLAIAVDAIVEPVGPAPTGEPAKLESAGRFSAKSETAATKGKATKANGDARKTTPNKATAKKAAKHSSGQVTVGSVRKTYAKGKHSSGLYAEGKHAAIARTHGSTDDGPVLQILGVVNRPITRR